MENSNVNNFINDSMMSYASYVLTQRALPDFRDGLKPVQRRILFSMKINNVTKLTKSANVGGKIMELHPHGSVYGSIVALVQKDRQNIPFIIGQGSFGQFTSSTQEAAADRYTEVKLGQPALEAMKNLVHNCVNMIPNFDGTIMVPEVFPVTYPTILTQALSGVGVGFSSSTLPFNLYEIREVIKEYLENGNINTIVPDFPTGGIILKDDESFKEIMKTGKGSVNVRSKVKIEGNKIIVYEIPYGVKREEIISKIIQLNKDKKLPEVSDIRDGTSFTGMKIVITLKRNVNANEVLEKLYLMTKMQASVSCNTNILFNGYPKVMSIEEIIVEWVKWRKQIILVSLKDDLIKKKTKLNLLKGLEKILNNIDEVIKIIRFEKEDEVNNKLMSRFDLDKEQTQAIVDMKLKNLNKIKIEKQIKYIEDYKKNIIELEKNIKKESFINNYLLESMDESIKNIGVNQRKSEIKNISKKTIKIQKAIKNKKLEAKNYETTILLSKQGYIFKLDENDNLQASLRLGDEILSEAICNNLDRIFFFLEDGKGGTLTCDEIDLEKGIFLPNYFACENIYGMVNESQKDKIVTIGFEDGQMVRVPIENFIKTRKNIKNGYYEKSIPSIITLNQNGKIKINKKQINISDIPLKKSTLSKGRSFSNKPHNKYEII